MATIDTDSAVEAGPVRRVASRIEGVDALRGVAALVVVFFHGPEVEGILRPLRPLQTIGFSGVGLFLVLSGFSIHYRWAESGRDGLFDQGRFWRRRVRRLYPTYAAAVIISALVIVMIGDGGPASVPWVITGGNAAVVVGLVGQVLLVGANIVPTPYVGVCWSLALELQLYAAYSAIVNRLRRIGVVRVVLLSAAISLVWRIAAELVTTSVPMGQFKPGGSADGLSRLFYSQLPARWFEWMLGLLVAEAYFGNLRMPRALRNVPLMVVTLVVSAALFRHQVGQSSLNGHPFFVSDLFLDQLYGLGYAALLVWALGRSNIPVGAAHHVLRPLAWVGLFSYSLYLVHGAALGVVAWLFPNLSNLPDVALSMAASIAAGYALYLLVERRFLQPATHGVRATRVAAKT